MSTDNNSRRKFIKTIGSVGAGLATVNIMAKAEESTPSRLSGAKYMGGFIAPKLDTVRVAVIGCGQRAKTHVRHLALLEHTEVVGLCDLYEDLTEREKKVVLDGGKGKRHLKMKTYFGDKHAYKKMLAETKPDLVYVVTPWEWHAPMAIDAMNAGAHVCVEVPLTMTLEESWDIVNTSEKTQKHCMMLENVNYGRVEMMYLNMCRQGVFGDLLHGEASYIHGLKSQMKQYERGRGTGSWRTVHWANKDGNLYPTHGLGPVAQYMNIGRTEDTFSHIVSMTSPALGRTQFVEKTKATSKLRELEFKGGDISTSIIQTKLGRTIMIQWDECTPRPYSRHNLIQGTKRTAAGYPNRISEGHHWKDIKPLYNDYEHPLHKRVSPLTKNLGDTHGGMDGIMNYRVIECLRTGQPLDQNVYEGCLWSAVTPLSIASVAERGAPKDFPDFTRGEWKNTAPLPIVT